MSYRDGADICADCGTQIQRGRMKVHEGSGRCKALQLRNQMIRDGYMIANGNNRGTYLRAGVDAKLLATGYMKQESAHKPAVIGIRKEWWAPAWAVLTWKAFYFFESPGQGSARDMVTRYLAEIQVNEQLQREIESVALVMQHDVKGARMRAIRSLVVARIPKPERLKDYG